MGQPVKLSDTLVSDARIVGKLMERSIAGQVEFWARLGQAMEPMLDGTQVLTLCQTAQALPLSSCLETVDTAEGRLRLADALQEQPFPHYQAHPERPGLLIRIDADGGRVAGRFINRQFQAE